MEMQWKYCISPVCDKQIQFQSTKERRKSKNNCLNQIIHTKELKLKTELTNKMQALIMKLIIKLSITIWEYISVSLFCNCIVSPSIKEINIQMVRVWFLRHILIKYYDSMPCRTVAYDNQTMANHIKIIIQLLNDCINPGALIKSLYRKFGYW